MVIYNSFLFYFDICIKFTLSFVKFVTEDMIFRGSHSQMFFKIGVLKYFVIFTEKHLC